MIKGKITYNSSSVVELTPETPEVILSTANKYCLGDFGAEFECPVYNGSIITGISVTTPPTKTVYAVGETLDLNGIVVKDNLGNDVTTQCIFTPANGTVLTSSDTDININYLGITCTQAISIVFNYLCFTANTAGSTVKLNSGGWTNIETSTDRVTWNTYTAGTVLTMTNAGDKLYWRGINNVIIGDASLTGFVMTGMIAASGNANSLLSYTENITDLNGRAYCYCGMFYNCVSLISAPELPSTILFSNCYRIMFSGCTGLTNVPALPATNLANNCYYGMFAGCTGLTTLPENLLPATTLQGSCYYGMFTNCTGLTTLPKLPSLRIMNYYYYSMFEGCSKIKLSTTQTGNYQIPYRIPTEGTGAKTSSALDNMFSNTGGTFTGTPSVNTTYYLWDYNL